MSKRAVIFDLFGTLVDSFSAEAHTQLLHDMARVVGAPDEAFAKGWHGTLILRGTGRMQSIAANVDYICQSIGFAPPREKLLEAERLRIEFTRDGLVPRADAVETLGALGERGIQTGLISDYSGEIMDLWPDTPLAPLFEEAIFSAAVGCMKPAQEIYAMACERLDVKPEECLYVGDGGSHELTGATAAGMEAVQIWMPHEDEYSGHKIHFEDWRGPRITSLREVLEKV